MNLVSLSKSFVSYIFRGNKLQPMITGVISFLKINLI